MSEDSKYNPNLSLSNAVESIFKIQHELMPRRFQADLMLQIDVHEEIDGSLVMSLHVGFVQRLFERFTTV